MILSVIILLIILYLRGFFSVATDNSTSKVLRYSQYKVTKSHETVTSDSLNMRDLLCHRPQMHRLTLSKMFPPYTLATQSESLSDIETGN